MVVGSWRNFKSLGATVAQSEAIYRDAVAKKPRNILALNHEPLETTAHQVLPYAINLLKRNGYQLVTLAECLNLPAYQWESTPGVPDVSPLFSLRSQVWVNVITDPPVSFVSFLSHHSCVCQS